MERRLSVRNRALKSLALIVLMMLMAASRADDAIVLVTYGNSPIEEISSLDIRKAYLGISVQIGETTVRPVRRNEDDRLNMIFMQSVIAMSQKSYERRLLSMMLKYGTPRPIETDSLDEVLERLMKSPGAIAYMWKSDADAETRVRTIRVLWQEH